MTTTQMTDLERERVEATRASARVMVAQYVEHGRKVDTTWPDTAPDADVLRAVRKIWRGGSKRTPLEYAADRARRGL
jgi:hypothetical protein